MEVGAILCFDYLFDSYPSSYDHVLIIKEGRLACFKAFRLPAGTGHMNVELFDKFGQLFSLSITCP